MSTQARPSKPRREARPHRSTKSKVVAIVSDIHFDQHDTVAWRAFRKWHKDTKPDTLVILGDFVDFGMLSHYVQESKAPLNAVPQIKMFVKEANELKKECERLIVMEGNHDERWLKYIAGALPYVIKDALGLTLKDQCRYQGLSHDVEWVREGIGMSGLKVGQFLLRHGHRQSGRFGGGKHLAANKIMKSMGQCEVFGHHHRAQMFCQTAGDRTAIAISNPCMTREHDYAVGADWQRGFTILELMAPDYKLATPQVVVMQKGRFAYGGKTYDGNI